MSEKARDLLALSDLSVSDVMGIIERAQDMAAFWNQRRMVQSLAGHRFALVVNDSGWRNTTAFPRHPGNGRHFPPCPISCGNEGDVAQPPSTTVQFVYSNH